MKKFLYLLLIFIGTQPFLQAQINFQGCTPFFDPQTFVLNPTGTTNDGGTIRNTYQNTPPLSCSGLGGCVIVITWNIALSRWEIQGSDGVTNFGAFYFNTSASFPDPPDLTLGNWIENNAITGGACGGNNSISTLSGNVQNTVGSSSAPEIDVLGNGNSIADGDVLPSPVDGTDFGSVNIGNSTPQIFVIDNSAGTALLTINSIVISGSQAADFVVSGAPTSVAAGASASFTVTFTPSGPSVRFAILTINNNDADEAVYNFDLRGDGIEVPEINVTGNGNTILDGDVTPRIADGTNFGNVNLGANDPQVFVIDNSAGTGFLTISSIVITGAQAADFAISGAPASVAPGANASFTVTFSPSAAGVRNATVTINNNDANEAVYNFAVRGTGVGNPEINLLGLGNSITDGDVTPSTADDTDFGNVTLGGNDVHTFTIDNTTGTAVLSISTINISGTNSGNFAVGGITLPANIAAGATISFTLTFTPSAVGVRNATVTVNNNDANEAVYDFAVRGTGLAVLPSIAITEWLNNPQGNEATDEWVELYNYGATPVDLQNWEIEDEDADNAVITTNSFVIPSGGYVIIAKNKAAFEAQWLGGCASPNVLEAIFTLANGGDEIIIKDASNNIIWSVAYQNDELEGAATHYTEAPTFTNRIWGSKASPGVDRSGNDPATTTLGYEGNNITADPNVITSTTGDLGSPFDGAYVPPVKDVVRGDALDFDGVNDIVIIGDVAALDGISQFTYGAWIKMKTFNDFGRLFGNSELNGFNTIGTAMTLGSTSGSLNLVTRNGANSGGTTGNVLPLNTWTHVSMVFDGTQTGDANRLKCYINGIEVPLTFSGNAIPTTLISNNEPLVLGSNFVGLEFPGEMDEVAFWNVARTATEIRENMHLTLKDCPVGLVAYYQMNDGTGSATLTDHSGNGNNGTLTNMDPVTDWVTSGVNVGNDGAGISNSQTRSIAAGTGTRQANFNSANLFLELVGNTTTEEYTVTYQAFTPNTTIGVTATTLLQNPMWTINKQTAAATPKMNLRFQYPAGTFSNFDGTKYRLYWRPMHSEGDWSAIKNYALLVTNNQITFTDIYETGQFMVVQTSEQLISAVRGEMYDFAGTNDYIEIPNTINVPGDWTTELWFKSAGSNNYENLIHTNFPNADQGFRVELSSNFPNGHLYFSISTSNVFRPHTIVPLGGMLNANEWYHLAIVGDRTNNRVRAYLNGRLVTDEAHTDWPNTWPATVLGRGFTTNASRDFNGSLDEVRFWNSTRTQDEIRANMHLTLKGTEADLLSYYQFNDDLAIGTANGVLDAMGINNGTTVNMTAANYLASEVAVAGGVSERMNVTNTGLMNFGIPNVAIDFNSNPNGEIVVSRLMTEKPHGWEAIAGDVDNEYFVIWNYGSNQAPVIASMRFDEISYLAPSTLAADVVLHKRGSRQFGPTWGTPIAPASSITAGLPGNAIFSGAPLTTGFSQLVLAQTGPVSSLPIELVSFEAERANRQEVQLRWMTSMEWNNKGFEVERMLQGETAFTKVANVASKGNSSSLTTYYQLDPNSFTGMAYYRLKQVDADGRFEYTPTRAVAGMALPNGEGMSVFPNPTQGDLNFQILEPLAAQEAHIILVDAQGRVVREQWMTISSDCVIHLPNLLSNLPANLYFLQVQTTDGQQQWSKKISLR